jgi:hypothetical protein
MNARNVHGQSVLAVMREKRENGRFGCEYLADSNNEHNFGSLAKRKRFVKIKSKASREFFFKKLRSFFAKGREKQMDFPLREKICFTQSQQRTQNCVKSMAWSRFKLNVFHKTEAR